jgi:hypothetical protein
MGDSGYGYQFGTGIGEEELNRLEAPALGIPRTRRMGQSWRMTRPRVLGQPSGPTRSSRPSAEWSVADDPTACGIKVPAFWSRMIASVTRPSGALRCSDLLCQFRLTNQGCQSKLTGMDIEKLSVDVSSDDPAIGLRASLALHRLAERVEANHVASAREKGWSWQQIGDALGVTRQSVHTKYNKESS